jgi:simple sugar transport system permease protein
MNFILALLSSYQTVYSSIANTNASNPMTVVIQPRIEPIITVITVIIIVIGYSLSLQKTVPGFQLRMVGKNSRFAQISGINSSRVIISAALIGGALSGLVAAGEILGVYHILYDGYAAGMGNNGIIAGLIGQNTPIGMILSSLVLGSLQSGSVLLSVNTNVPIQIIQVVQGFVMLFATINFVTLLIRPHLRRNA